MLGDIRFWVEQRLAWLVQYGTITRSSANGADAVSGRVSGVQHEARRFWPWGLRSVPPVGSETITLGVDGSSANKVEIAAESTSRTAQGLEYTYGPKDLQEGEAALYCKVNGTLIRLSADGLLALAAAAPKDVVVNGGTQPVARKSDPVQITSKAAGGALALWMFQVETAINSLIPGSVTALSDTFVASPGVVIKDGAPRFKA